MAFEDVHLLPEMSQIVVVDKVVYHTESSISILCRHKHIISPFPPLSLNSFLPFFQKIRHKHKKTRSGGEKEYGVGEVTSKKKSMSVKREHVN